MPSNQDTSSEKSQIISALHRLRTNERKTQAEFLRNLAICDANRLYLPANRTLFDFMTKTLLYSASSAMKRIQIARLSQRFPEVLNWLAKSEITMTNLNLLAPHAKSESYLAQAKGLSKRQCELLVCQAGPRPEPRDCIRPIACEVPSPALSTSDVAENPRQADTAQAELTGLGDDEDASAQASDTPPRDRVSTTHPILKRVAVQFTAGASLCEKLQRAKQVLSHTIPDGRFEHILEAALDALLDQKDPLRRARRAEKRKSRVRAKQDQEPAVHPAEKLTRPDAMTGSTRKRRYIPAAQRHQVWQRDAGLCQFKQADGSICGAAGSIEIDHVQPFALGGSHSPANLQLLCFQHNRWRAQQSFAGSV